MTSTLSDLLRNLDTPQADDPAEQARAAAFVRSRCTDADIMLDALGLPS